MRKAARVDENQNEIVSALQRAGCSVQILSSVGQGCPDILVGMAGTNWILEIKNSARSPSKRKLTPEQKQWHAAWKGQVNVVETIDDAFRVVGLLEEK